MTGDPISPEQRSMEGKLAILRSENEPASAMQIRLLAKLLMKHGKDIEYLTAGAGHYPALSTKNAAFVTKQLLQM